MRFLIFLPAIIFIACNSGSNKTAAVRTDTVATSVAFVSPPRSDSSAVPADFIHRGAIQDVYHWTDKLGENLFFTTVVAPYADHDKNEASEEGRSVEVYAFHYVKTKDSAYSLLWEFKDEEMYCPVDVLGEFIRDAATVTDLDSNGIAEVKVQYALACRGDVSPSEMKLVMEENKKVYKLEGHRWMRFEPSMKFDIDSSTINLEKLPQLDDGEDDLLRSFGRYSSEKDFTVAPPSFLTFARKEWLKYVIEE